MVGVMDSSSPEIPAPQEPRDVQVSSYYKAFIAVTVCGLINNFTYCIVSGASQSLAKHFHSPDSTTAFSTGMNFSCLVGTFIHTGCMLGMSFYARVLLLLGLVAIALLGIAFSALSTGTEGLLLCILFSCIAGFAQVVGECTNISFLKAFPSSLIGAWGAGTGLAGVLGGGAYIVLSGPMHWGDPVIFFAVTPLLLVYWGAFHYLHKEAVRGREGLALKQVLGGRARAKDSAEAVPLAEEPRQTAPATLGNLKRAVQCAGSIMFNLVAVYCLEYFIYPGLADRETMCANKAWYTTFWICYNIGVTLSRLSVSLFRVQRVWLLTVFQFINVVGWLVEVYTGAIRDSLPGSNGLWIMAAWMILVGLCGGATYGNCMHLFNNSDGIPDELRELGVNLGFIMSNIGITIATFSFQLLDRTIMKESIIYPPDGCPTTSAPAELSVLFTW